MNRLGRFLLSPWFAVILLLLSYGLAISAVAHKSPTFDEVTHLTGGYAMWRENDYRLFPDNGNLPQRLGGLASLWRKDKFPSLDQQPWHDSNVYQYAEQLFYKNGNDAEGIMWSGRCLMALLIPVLGAAIYFASRALYGPTGGLVSLILFAFCPSMLGHGALVTSDVMVSLFFLLALWSFWQVLQRVTALRLVLSGLAVSGLLLAKASGVFIVPMALMLVIARALNPEPLPVFNGNVVRSRGGKYAVMVGVIIIQAVIAWSCIWGAYGFRYSIFNNGVPFVDRVYPGGWEYVLDKGGVAARVVQEFRELEWLPEGYIYGIAFVATAGQARQSFLNGEFNIYGSRQFFPYAFSVKETIPYFLLLALALAGFVGAFLVAKKKAPGSEWRYLLQRFYATAPLWSIILVYGLFAVTSRLNIGHRHLFPLYPPLFILAGAAGGWLTGRTRWLAALVVALLVWHAAESFAVRPNYLTYFNEFAGGPSQGYRHIVDSSLDWGQDLEALRDWLRAHQLESGSTPVYLTYFGTANPEYYKIRATQLPGFIDRAPVGSIDPLKPGIYCISATHRQGVYLTCYGPWTDHYEMAYQGQLRMLREYGAAAGKPEELKKLNERYSAQTLQVLAFEFPRLRIARLCAWLRKENPRPEALINNTVFVYNLSEDQLRDALEGPQP